MNTEKILCPRCGAAKPADAPHGLCPACLLAAGFSATEIPAPDATARLAADAPALAAGHAEPQPGQDFGEYRILSLLGQGGMGAVYAAEQRATGRRVAVKVMSRALASETDRKRFLREGRLAASVSHPNVVYVFGSEEIAGNPVIVMELVGGGTLHARVQREGPLPVIEAVEALLQMIEGLEAAHAAGVLHRDLKPANCFVGADGAVKVGDFGLSISTLARGESLLTAQGTMLGTPAYASPEQLRGEDLDVRTDIYAAGATLYYLLTGHAPFAAADLVRLIATVLEKAPEPPRKLNPKIPRALAQVILRCLAKNRAKRYANYQQLSAALQQASAPLVALRPGLVARMAAGLLDIGIALGLVWFMAGWIESPAPAAGISGRGHVRLWSLFAVLVLLFALPEWLWGATPGKWLFRLQVRTAAGHPPGLGRALIRSGCYFLLLFLVAAVSVTAVTLVPKAGETLLTMMSLLLVFFVLGLFFCTAFGKEDALLHDWLSGTRVRSLRLASGQPPFVNHARGGLRVEPFAVAIPPNAPRFGHYQACQLLWRRPPAEELWLGGDAVLRRRVWIHVRPPGSAAVPPERQRLARLGRLRWLWGRRSETEAWDVYEAFAGEALLATAARPQPWAKVSPWLCDLAEEHYAGSKHGCPPPLSLDQIWLAAGGRACFLDFPCPGANRGEGEPRPTSEPPEAVMEMQPFLEEAALTLLTGTRDKTARAKASPPLLVPLSAFRMLENLRRRTFGSWDVASLRQLTRQRIVSRVTWRRRLLSLLPSVLLCWYLAGIAYLPDNAPQGRELDVRQPRPAMNSLEKVLRVREAASAWRHPVEALDIRIAGQFGALISHRDFTDPAVEKQLGRKRLELARAALARHPSPTPEQIAQAIQRTELMVAKSGQFSRTESLVRQLCGIWLVVFLLCPNAGFWLGIFGIALVTREGREPARHQHWLRHACAWAPGLAALLALSLRFHGGPWTTLADCLLIPFFLILQIVMLTWAVLHPQRGLPDCLAGTYVVPR